MVETTVESGCGFEDVTTLMEWNSEGVASLPGSDIKFTINEFGMLEMVDLNRVRLFVLFLSCLEIAFS